METSEEIEAVLEKIWDIHDKLSDAIHSISRSHFLNTVKTLKKTDDIFFTDKSNKSRGKGDDDRSSGYVFMKDVRMVADESAIAEAKSLNAIRTALENLEDQLEFFHTVQLQQRAERDAAIARLEQSRIVLAMRLADHHGKKYKVIEEALAFVGDVQNAGRFISPENLFESPRSQSGDISKSHERKRSSILMRVLSSSFTFAKRSLNLEQMGGVLGHAALVAVSMFALLQFQQVSSRNSFVVESPQMEGDIFYGKSSKISQREVSSSNGFVKNLDVLAARG